MPRHATLPRLSQVLGVDPLEFLAAESAESLYLRALRVVRGLGLRELAHAANSWSSTLGRWESRDPVTLPDAEAVRAPARDRSHTGRGSAGQGAAARSGAAVRGASYRTHPGKGLVRPLGSVGTQV